MLLGRNLLRTLVLLNGRLGIILLSGRLRVILLRRGSLLRLLRRRLLTWLLAWLLRRLLVFVPSVIGVHVIFNLINLNRYF